LISWRYLRTAPVCNLFRSPCDKSAFRHGAALKHLLTLTGISRLLPRHRGEAQRGLGRRTAPAPQQDPSSSSGLALTRAGRSCGSSAIARLQPSVVGTGPSPTCTCQSPRREAPRTTPVLAESRLRVYRMRCAVNSSPCSLVRRIPAISLLVRALPNQGRDLNLFCG
jgi:hypothetical protein